MKQLILVILITASISANAQTDLNYYINAAKQNSPLINDNKNQSKANLLDVERLKAFYTKPQVGITASYLFAPIISRDNQQNKLLLNPDNPNNYSGYDMAASNGGTYQALVNFNQPLFNGKIYKSASEQLSVASKVNENTAKISEHDIKKIVTDQYILCLQDNKQTQYAEATIQLLNDQKNILKPLVENSIYKQSDFTLLNIELQNFLSQLVNLKANFRRDLMDLNILCGINDTTLLVLQNVELALNNSVTNSAFLEKYHLDSLNLIAQQKLFEIKYKPQLNIFANAGLNAVYAPTIPNRFGMSAGISFLYNIFDGNQKAINRNKIEVLNQSVTFYKNNFITQNNIRKSKIVSELQSYTERISIAEQQLKDYDFLLKSYKNEIISGQLTIINYITVLKNLATVQRDYTLLFSQQQSLINAYNYWNW
jgi:outer membrane protein TolC